MLVHAKCSQKVTLDLSESLKFVAGFGFKNGGLSVNMVNMVTIKKGGKAKFICPSCQEEVPLKDVAIYCLHCGHVVPATEGVLPDNAGGVYCKACGDDHFGGQYTPLNIASYTISNDAIRS